MAAWKFVGGEIFAAFDEDEVNFQRFSYRFETVRKLVDTISGVEELEIKVTNGYRNPTFKITRKDVDEGKIINKLAKYGVSLENCEEFQVLAKQIIFETESKLPQTITHNELGFVEIENTECFLADKLYVYDDQFKLRSVCAAPQMKPKGTFKQYRDFILAEVCNSPKLSLAFVLGVTAPVSYILKKHGAFYETLLWSFCGESSSGKTTSLLSMLSIFGNGQFLLSNLNATSNALAAQISGQSGFPFCADEATRSNIDFDELIYSLSSGKGKLRCNGDGTLKKPVNFSGAAFFSSEQPILDKCTEQGGEEARVVEFEIDWFDGDGEKAERFLRFFNTHYGVVAPHLAALILNPKIQRAVVRNFNRFYSMLKKMIQTRDGIDNRILQRFAIICTACWLLEKALKVGLHMDAIVKLLTEVFQEKQTRICRTDGTERLLQLFVEDLIHNRDQYLLDKDVKKSARHSSYIPHVGSLRGISSTFQGKPCVWLPSDTFNEILNRQSTYGANTAKKKLHEGGYLCKFGEAYYRWHNFGTTSANAYCIFLPQQLNVSQYPTNSANNSTLSTAPPPKMVAGFVSLTSQQTDMVINKSLADALGVKTSKDLFLHTFGAKDFLILDTTPSDSALKLTFTKTNDSFVSTNPKILDVLKTANIHVGRLTRLLITDISISSKQPCATIFVQNPYGQWCGSINNASPYQTSDVFNNGLTKNINKANLLSEEEE